MSKKGVEMKIVVFECKSCDDAHLAIMTPDGDVVFSAGLPPEVWAAMFRDVALIEAKHAAKH